jgi:molybdopterin synthase sulfur carrier subunit
LILPGCLVVRVYIKAYGLLGDYVKEGFYEFREGATVKEVIESIIPESIRGRFSVSVFVNGEAATGERVLREGDRVVLLPPSSGG